MPDKVVIYTDGACRGNPGPGGWGAVLRFGPHEKSLYGAERETTNNRMDQTGARKAVVREAHAPTPLSQRRLMPDKVVIYTDGACRGNPGPGGWGAVLRFGPHEKSLYGAERETTNNRMELKAAIEALSALRRRCRVELHTDSRYLRDGVLQWMKNWKRKNWKNANRKPVKNRDLWEALDDLLGRHDIAWHWVKAHAGNPGNERADQLANRGIDELPA